MTRSSVNDGEALQRVGHAGLLSAWLLVFVGLLLTEVGSREAGGGFVHYAAYALQLLAIYAGYNFFILRSHWRRAWRTNDSNAWSGLRDTYQLLRWHRYAVAIAYLVVCGYTASHDVGATVVIGLGGSLVYAASHVSVRIVGAVLPTDEDIPAANPAAPVGRLSPDAE